MNATGVYRQHLTARGHKHTFLSAHFTRNHTFGSRHFACLKSQFVIGHVFAEHSFKPVSTYFLFTHYLTDASDWNQIKPLCSFARGWTAWPSGRSDAKHKGTRWFAFLGSQSGCHARPCTSGFGTHVVASSPLLLSLTVVYLSRCTF